MTRVAGSYGNVVELTAPARVEKGEFLVQSGVAGIAADAIANGATGAVILNGVFELEPRNAATTFAIGGKCYSANGSKKVNNTAANGLTTFVGYALEASANDSAAAIKVLLARGGA